MTPLGSTPDRVFAKQQQRQEAHVWGNKSDWSLWNVTKYFLWACLLDYERDSITKYNNVVAVLTVDTSFSNQVSVKLGVHTDLSVVHAVDL